MMKGIILLTQIDKEIKNTVITDFNRLLQVLLTIVCHSITKTNLGGTVLIKAEVIE